MTHTPGPWARRPAEIEEMKAFGKSALEQARAAIAKAKEA